jgi:hypothetical protein
MYSMDPRFIRSMTRIRISCREHAHRRRNSSRDRRHITSHGNLNNWTWSSGNSWIRWSGETDWIFTVGLVSIVSVCWTQYTLPSPCLPRLLPLVCLKKMKRPNSRTASLILINIHFTTKWNEMKWNVGPQRTNELKWNEMLPRVPLMKWNSFCVFICNWIKKRREPRANNVTLKLRRVRVGDKPLKKEPFMRRLGRAQGREDKGRS